MAKPYIASESDLYRLKTDKLSKDGYDGVILDTPTGNIYMVFDNTQIKSATDNIGTFDKTNPDIRYSISNKSQKSAEDPYFTIAEQRSDISALKKEAADEN